MAGREMLFGEGPTACPFVALENDRDRRSDEPDHRHRCYAEPEPQPRALAHQRAYCLSSGFAGCPIFQDWAVRAAARPVPLRPDPRQVHDDRPAVDDGEGMSAPVPSWAAPPPWAGRDEVAAFGPEQMAAFGADEIPGRRPDQEEPDEVRDAAALAPPLAPPVAPPPVARPPSDASAAAARQAPDRSADEIERVPSLPPEPSGDAARDARLEEERRRRLEADRQRRQEEERRRRLEAERRERERAAAAAAAVPPFLAGRAASGTAESGAEASGGSVSAAAAPGAPASSSPAPPQGVPARAQARREDLVPIWEREPIQAYPTLRRRIGAGGSGGLLGTLATIFAVLAILALAVFAIIALPSLLGSGGGAGPGGTAPVTGSSPGTGATAAPPTGPSSPTVPPTPSQSPRTYTIQAGDTLFGVSLEFGVTVDQLLAANPQITDPNIVSIGQVIVIPDPDEFPASAPPAASTPGT